MDQETGQRPQFSDWMRSLRAKAAQAAQDEEEERRWQERFAR